MVADSFEIIKGMSYEEYAARPGVRASLLGDVHSESLRTVKAKIDGLVDDDSKAKDFGTAFHALLLEGKKEFVEQPSNYPVDPEAVECIVKPWNNNSNFCKDWRDKQTKTILTAKEIENLVGMVEAVKEEEDLKPWLSGETEVSMFATQRGIPLKIRLDIFNEDPDAPIIDPKKTRDASLPEFTKQAWKLFYMGKAAFYLDVARLCGFPKKAVWFVGVEEFYPFNTSILKMNDGPVTFLSAGRRLYKAAFQKLINAKTSNNWPSYGSDTPENHLTKWMQDEIEIS